MPQGPLKDLNEILGITLQGNESDRDVALKLLRASLPVASELLVKAAGSAGLSPISNAAMAAVNTVTALVASAAPRCNLEAPPKDIDARVDSSGNLIYRCQHNPPHEWDLTGRPLP
jgi:hypothetical protein